MSNQAIFFRRKRAFTLIELLVVIAIIAILAAILFPVFAQAKLAAKKTAGLAQMKQIGTASALYGGDYDDGLPAWSTAWVSYYNTPIGLKADDPDVPQSYWDYKLAPYVKSGDLVKLNADGSFNSQDFSGLWKSPGVEYDPKRGRSIGMNQLLMWNMLTGVSGGAVVASTNPATGTYRYPSGNIIETPADTVFVADGGMSGKYDPPYLGGGFDQKWFPQTVSDTNEGYNCKPKSGDICRAAPWRYGNENANYVFCDSHAKNFKGDQIYANPGHKVGPASSWTAAQKAPGYCAARKYFAVTGGERDLLNAQVTGGCPN